MVDTFDSQGSSFSVDLDPSSMDLAFVDAFASTCLVVDALADVVSPLDHLSI